MKNLLFGCPLKLKSDWNQTWFMDIVDEVKLSF